MALSARYSISGHRKNSAVDVAYLMSQRACCKDYLPGIELGG